MHFASMANVILFAKVPEGQSATRLRFLKVSVLLYMHSAANEYSFLMGTGLLLPTICQSFY